MTNDRSDAQAASDMGVDVAALRKVAEAAKPGPWRHYPATDHLDPFTVFALDEAVDRLSHVASIELSGERRFGNAEYIATFDPPTVLKLLDLIDAKDRELAELRSPLHECDWRESVRRNSAEVLQLRAKLDAVRALHQPDADADYCKFDGFPWPCTTFEAIDGDA